MHLLKCLDFFFNGGETKVLVKSNPEILIEHCLSYSFTVYLDYNCLSYEVIKKIIKKDGEVPFPQMLY